MRYPIAVIVCLAMGACTSVAPSDGPSKGGGWKPIPLVKDGKVSDDWVHVGFGKFDVVEGDRIRTNPDGRGLGLLVYKTKTIGDCQLRVVFKPETPKSNSGVYIRIDVGILAQVGKEPIAVLRAADGSLPAAEVEKMKRASETENAAWYAVHHGFEVQIADGGDPAHRTGAVYSLAKAQDLPDRQPDGWRTMVITLRGTKVDVEVDGKPVSSFDSADAGKDREKRGWTEPKLDTPRPTSGYIGLQTHDPGDIVTFKEVSVRPLKGK